MPSETSTASQTTSRFLRACQRLPVDRTPVWFMRQAGRSLPEYRELRKRHAFFEITRQPELCAEVTLQPVRRLGVDAAILFSDIVLPLVAIGLDLDLVEGTGPVIAHPIREQRDLAALRPLEPAADIPYVLESIALLRRELAGSPTALIGFAGAPFTLAGYLVEGRPSRDFVRTRQLMYGEPELWNALMERLTDIVILYVQAQVAAGAQAIQIFDSWIGALGRREYERYVQPHMRRIFDALQPPETPQPVPMIHFGTGTAPFLESLAEAGGDVIGLDWHLPLDEGWQRLGGPERIAVQGNLDPAVLLAPWQAVEAEASDVLRRAGGNPGYIFNLGHGILPATPAEHLERLVQFVHDYPLS